MEKEELRSFFSGAIVLLVGIILFVVGLYCPVWIFSPEVNSTITAAFLLITGPASAVLGIHIISEMLQFFTGKGWKCRS